MTLPYDDSLDKFALGKNPSDAAVPKPHIKIIVDGKSVFMPGMKTYLAGDEPGEGSLLTESKPGDSSGKKDSKKIIGGQYCSCDTVFVGSREQIPAPDASSTGSGTESSGSGSTGGGQTCTCDTVNTCSSNCGCVNYTTCSCVGHSTCSCVGHSTCSCVSHTNSGGGGSVSCGSPCACVPVH
ncbi:MAG: hypothetical protein FWD65_02275 [Coriobacteriia bacterium]|nr:hypothetical protein [Coriobacteriia bacterium]